MKPVPPWPAVTTTTGFEVQERSLPDHANLFHDNEKGLNVVKLQVAKAYWAYAPLEHWSHLTVPWISMTCSESNPDAAR